MKDKSGNTCFNRIKVRCPTIFLNNEVVQRFVEQRGVTLKIDTFQIRCHAVDLIENFFFVGNLSEPYSPDRSFISPLLSNVNRSLGSPLTYLPSFSHSRPLYPPTKTPIV